MSRGAALDDIEGWRYYIQKGVLGDLTVNDSFGVQIEFPAVRLHNSKIFFESWFGVCSEWIDPVSELFGVLVSYCFG